MTTMSNERARAQLWANGAQANRPLRINCAKGSTVRNDKRGREAFRSAQECEAPRSLSRSFDPNVIGAL